MNENAVREMVRQALAHRLGGGEQTAPDEAMPYAGAHMSHARYALPESGGPCLIEPSVPCNHCGYCQSHGH